MFFHSSLLGSNSTKNSLPQLLFFCCFSVCISLFLFASAFANAQLKHVSKSVNAPYLDDEPNDNIYDFSISADQRFLVFASDATNLVLEDIDVDNDPFGAVDIFLIDLTTGNRKSITHGSNGNSGSATISADGRYVAFQSAASNLVANDPNGTTSDIFVYDRIEDSIRLLTAGGDYSSRWPVISANGEYIAFTSSASNLSADDVNGQTADIFVAQRRTGILELITPKANASCYDKSISSNGRYIAFDCEASKLVDDDPNGRITDVFVFDRDTNTTELISYDGNSDSRAPSISDNGRYVAFESNANNLAPGDTAGIESDIYLYDRDTGTMQLLTPSTNGFSNSAKISKNGRYVSFSSQASTIVSNDTNGSERDIFLFDQQTGVTRLITPGGNGPSGAPVFNLETSTLLFNSRASNLSTERTQGRYINVYAHNLVTEENTRLVFSEESFQTMQSGGNGDSSWPVISEDDRFVVYASDATNLTEKDANPSSSDIFLFDRETDATDLITSGSSSLGSASPTLSRDGNLIAFESRARGLVPGVLNASNNIYVYNRNADTFSVLTAGANNSSFRPIISDNGRYIAFQSSASNLVSNDSNGSTIDIFLFDRLLNSMHILTPGANAFSMLSDTRRGISANGQFVVYESTASNLAPGKTEYEGIFLYDHSQATTQFVGHGDSPDITPDGRFIVFAGLSAAVPPSSTRLRQIFLYDRINSSTELITQGADGASRWPTISSNGRYVSFLSSANNLSNSQGDCRNSICGFVYDRNTGQTARTFSGDENFEAGFPSQSISAAGDFVALSSNSTEFNPVARRQSPQFDQVFLLPTDTDSDSGPDPDPAEFLTATLNSQSVDRPGPMLNANDAVNWGYRVFNNRSQGLNNVELRVRQKLPVLGGWTTVCSVAALAPGSALDCSTSGFAVSGRFKSLIVARATTDSGEFVEAKLDAFYEAGEDNAPTGPGMLGLNVTANGLDTGKPGPEIGTASDIQWLYTVTNDSSSSVSDIEVRGRQKLPALGSWGVLCTISNIAAGATGSCSTNSNAISGRNKFLLVARIPGNSDIEEAVVDVFYTGGEATDARASLAVSARINGEASAKPGPMLMAGGDSNWAYELSNTGTLSLNNVSVSVRQKLPTLGSWTTECTFSRLAPSSSETCLVSNANSLASGNFKSLVVARGTTDDGELVEVLLDAFYVGN